MTRNANREIHLMTPPIRQPGLSQSSDTAMSASHPTALVVDDDVISRRILGFALSAVGFDLGYAVDGNDALAKISEGDFDLVVTDLNMPGRHGHSLAVELLTRNPPPIIAVHTSFDDPRLAEDLMHRGVDDIVYKPTNYPAFAGKMKGLVSRRRNSSNLPTDRKHPNASSDTVSPPSRQGRDTSNTVSLADLERRLREVTHILPISHAALELVNLLSEDDTAEFGSIAQVIQRDASLCCEVIKVASRAASAAGRPKIVDLEDAIGTIGTRRIGEIAIAVSTLRTLTQTILPWLDAEAARIQGIAAQIALSLLCREGTGHQSDDGLALSAIVYQTGRVLLGTLYPQTYQSMVEACSLQGCMLSEIERSVFPMSHTAALAELLSNWGVPPDSFYPLKHVADSFSSLNRLAQPLRAKVETLKTAIVIGQCASGRWHPWETVEFPTQAVLKRLGIDSVQSLIENVKQGLAEVEPQTESVARPARDEAEMPARAAKIAYCNLSTPESDFLPAVLSSMGRPIQEHVREERTISRSCVVNCLGTPPTRLAAQGVLARDGDLVLVTELDLPPAFSQSGRIVRLPASYSVLKDACLRLAESRG